MTKQPDTRYQDGDQFAADLRAVIADLAGDSVVIATTAQFSGTAHNNPAANYDVIQITNLDQMQAFETTMVTLPDVAELPPGDANTDIKL